VHGHPQRPRGRDPRVLLPQRAGCRVARVGERGLAGVDEGGVELDEPLGREEHLAADLEQLRYVVAVHLGRDLVEGADVGGDVFTRTPVAAGGGAHEHSALVDEVDGEPVDLQLAQVADARATDVALHPRRPGGDLLVGERVVEAEHPLEVLDRREQRAVGPGHLLGRESAVRSSGCASSSAVSSRISRSYSASLTVGRSRT
jgi:hypothetical protein